MRAGTPYGDANGEFGDNQFRFSLFSYAAMEAPLVVKASSLRLFEPHPRCVQQNPGCLFALLRRSSSHSPLRASRVWVCRALTAAARWLHVRRRVCVRGVCPHALSVYL